MGEHEEHKEQGGGEACVNAKHQVEPPKESNELYDKSVCSNIRSALGPELNVKRPHARFEDHLARRHRFVDVRIRRHEQATIRARGSEMTEIRRRLARESDC